MYCALEPTHNESVTRPLPEATFRKSGIFGPCKFLAPEEAGRLRRASFLR